MSHYVVVNGVKKFKLIEVKIQVFAPISMEDGEAMRLSKVLDGEISSHLEILIASISEEFPTLSVERLRKEYSKCC